MRNKKGFVFVETMITIVILAAALLTMYTLFTNLLVNEKDRVYYDDPMYVYKANYLVGFIRDRFNYANSYLINNDPSRPYISVEDLIMTYEDQSSYDADPTIIRLNLKTLTCDNDIFSNETYSTKRDCQRFFYDQRLYRIYVSKADLSYMDYCDSHNTKECFEYRSLSKETKKYMRSLSYVPGVGGYYLIFEFNDDGEGNVCTSSGCIHQYAAVKYGSTNQIVNLNE